LTDKIIIVKSAFKHGCSQNDIERAIETKIYEGLLMGEVTMRDMTDEEYDALDERLTSAVPTLGPNGTGFFSRKGFQVVGLDENTAKILNAKAIASRQTPSEVVAYMRGKRLPRLLLICSVRRWRCQTRNISRNFLT
jgi:hypothetical protein